MSKKWIKCILFVRATPQSKIKRKKIQLFPLHVMYFHSFGWFTRLGKAHISGGARPRQQAQQENWFLDHEMETRNAQQICSGKQTYQTESVPSSQSQNIFRQSGNECNKCFHSHYVSGHWLQCFQVVNCHKCQHLCKFHKSLGSLFGYVLQMSLSLSLSFNES